MKVTKVGRCIRMKDGHYRFRVTNTIIRFPVLSQMSEHPDIYPKPGSIRFGAPHCECHLVAYHGPRAVCTKRQHRKRRGGRVIRMFIRILVNHGHGRESRVTDLIVISFFYPHYYRAPVFVFGILCEIHGSQLQCGAGRAGRDSHRCGRRVAEDIATHFYVHRQVAGWGWCRRYDKCGVIALYYAGRTWLNCNARHIWIVTWIVTARVILRACRDWQCQHEKEGYQAGSADIRENLFNL